ncbi:hypothetical protein KUV74_01495 [Halomonas sp. DP1Y21-3]|uniref:hypothetical protein n=1 Tax=Halomonas sp. DP1Y21-3 TaxID=2859080 RepID=UPI001C98487A|nr:hypothetical protein [Halomonas sp. DP1Y21-3]MBY6109065.1 hypothetical protein [Halomonas sp. DP1Y21-3]
MIGGLLAGGLAGGGKAVQTNALEELEHRRRTALSQLEHEQAMTRQDDQQSFSREERVAGEEFQTRRDETLHGYQQDNTRLSHGLSMEQERYRQGQQNARHYSSLSAQEREGANDWQMVRTEGGSLVQYSPSRNSYRDANLPEGAVMGGMDSQLSDRDKYRLDMLADEAETLRKKQADGLEPLSPGEKSRLGQIEAQMTAFLGGGETGGTTLERLLAGEEVSGGAGADEVAGSPDVTSSGGDGPSVRGLLNQQIAEQEANDKARESRRAATAASDRADAVLKRIERELSGGADPDGLVADINRAAGRGGSVSDETLDEAQRVAEELLSLDKDPNLSSDRRRWIAERLLRLQDAGIELNLQ